MIETTAMPHCERSERRILAAIMREPELAFRACEHHGIVDDAFFFRLHRTLFRYAKMTIKFHGAPDAATLYELGRQTGDTDNVSAIWFADTLDFDPTGAWCDHSCEQVKLLWARRDAIHRANELLRDAYQGGREPEFYINALNNPRGR